MSDSEDGQRNSSVGGDFSVGGHTGAATTTEADEEEDEHGGDSLDIKPPQARISRSRDNSITRGGRHHHHHHNHHKDTQQQQQHHSSGIGSAMRDKKHSKEKRHSKDSAMQHHHDDDLIGPPPQPHHHHQHRERGDRSEHRDRERKGRSERHSAGNEHHRRDEMLDSYHYRGVPPMRYSGGGGGSVEEERYRSKMSYENSSVYSGGGQRKGYFEVYSRDESSSYVASGKGGSDYGGHHRSHHHHSDGHDGGQSRHSERHKYSAYMEEYLPPRYDMPPKGKEGGGGKMVHDLHSRKYKMWKNVEDLEQDLRSRLVNKCKNFVADEHADYELAPVMSYGEGGRGHKVSSRHDKEHREREHNSHHRSSERSKNRLKVIEVLDSPEGAYERGGGDPAEDSGREELQRRRKHKQHKERLAVEEAQPAAVPAPAEEPAHPEKRKTPDDPELLARRAKIIAAYREKTKRREELEARRDQRRNDALSPSAIAASMTAGLKVVKRKSKGGAEEPDYDGDEDGAVKRKRRRVKKSKRSDGELDDDDEDEEMEAAARDDDDEDGEEEDSESDSDSDSKAEEQDSEASSAEEGALSDARMDGGSRAGRRLKKAKAKKHRAAEELYSDGDVRLPESPLSVSESPAAAAKKKRKHSKKSAGTAKHKHKHHHHRRRSGKHAEAGAEAGEAGALIHSLDSDDSMQSHKSESQSRSRSASPTSRSRSQSPLSVSDGEEEDGSGSSSGSRSASGSRSSRSRSQSRSPSRSQTEEGSERSSASRFRRRSRSRSRSGTRSEERGMDGDKEDSSAAPGSAVKVSGFNEDLLKASTGRASPTSRDGSPVCDDKGKPLPNYFPGIQGCRSVEEFQCLNRIEEGTYGVVYRAKDKRTNEIVALKRLKMEKEKEGFPITSLREINTLLKGQHPNIVTVREIVVGSNMDKIFIVMDYVEHDLKSLMETMKHRKQVFFPGEVKCLIQQLLRAVSHLHDNWILHRDLKTSNLLLSHKGILKVGDFGLAREYGSPLKRYTSLVVTLWYRAPELLLCSPEYSTGIDIWSVGCIFAEFLQMAPMFPGKTEIDQLNRIFKELGTPNEKVWPGYNELPAVKNLISQNSHFADYPVSNLRKHFGDRTTSTGVSLLLGLLTYDPKQRLTADSALKHEYFKELPLPIDPSMFPTWPAKSELGARKALASSPKPPSGGSQFKQLGRDDVLVGGGAGGGPTGAGAHKIVSGIITGNKKTAANTGFVLNAGIDQRQLAAKGSGSGGASGGGFKLKF